MTTPDKILLSKKHEEYFDKMNKEELKKYSHLVRKVYIPIIYVLFPNGKEVYVYITQKAITYCILHELPHRNTFGELL